MSHFTKHNKLMRHQLLLQLALAFVEYHLKRAEPLHHLGHGGAFISRLHAGHDKGVQSLAGQQC